MQGSTHGKRFYLKVRERAHGYFHEGYHHKINREYRNEICQHERRRFGSFVDEAVAEEIEIEYGIAYAAEPLKEWSARVDRMSDEDHLDNQSLEWWYDYNGW